MKQINIELNRSDKILLAIYKLDEKLKIGEKISNEDMIIKVWKMFPADFCMKGHLEYPNSDISKYITKLFKENLLKGNVYNYIITPKGKEYVEKLNFEKETYTKNNIISSSRQIDTEIKRIKKSKVFQIYLNGEKNFVESDFFDFLGTSSRSFNDYNKTMFISKYNFITQDLISYCEKIKETDSEAKKIILLTHELIHKFKHILDKKLKMRL